MFGRTAYRDTPPKEHRLVGAILAADWSAGAKRAWDGGLFDDIDWTRIPRLAWQHKIRPMMAATLREAGWPGVPADIKAEVEAAERACSLWTMAQLEMLTAIAAKASAQNLRVIATKGLALSVRFYGNPFIREAYDLDLLVHPSDSERFNGLLAELGCRPIVRGLPLTSRQAAILKRFDHHKSFQHAGNGAIVEGHFALYRNPHLIRTDFDALWQARAPARIGQTAVATLGDADLLYYLNIHAARHRWERWKWIADFVVLYRMIGAADLAAIRERANREGNQHLFDACILLTSAVTGLALPDVVAKPAALDRRAQSLAGSALEASAGDYAPTAAPRHLLVSSHFMNDLLLKRSLPYAVNELLRLFHHDADWHALGFPDRLIWLYYLMVPFAYVRRRVNTVKRRLFNRRKIG